MKKQTAIEQLMGWIQFTNKTAYNIMQESGYFEQAKALEKEQIIRFAISCHQNILRDRNAPENLISENLLLFEQYYNETYNK